MALEWQKLVDPADPGRIRSHPVRRVVHSHRVLRGRCHAQWNADRALLRALNGLTTVRSAATCAYSQDRQPKHRLCAAALVVKQLSRAGRLMMLRASNSDLIASATRVDPSSDAAAGASQTPDVARPISPRTLLSRASSGQASALLVDQLRSHRLIVAQCRVQANSAAPCRA